ncbi:hypothetical protein BGV66_17315 [Burkholderia ubonensis]|uniref:Uncharacterized protein n=1 Tax=Burkholderia ubonensis TaxID=101571 RepID=A0ABD6Q2X0_9BURK|nr:hypothetical protein BGV66_17315 [Burkholderia ubonensis]
MRRPQIAIRATGNFGQAIEHRIPGELPGRRIFNVEKIFAVRLPMADDQARRAERDGRQAVQAVARLMEASMERIQLIVDAVLAMLYVDAHGKGRSCRACRMNGAWRWKTEEAAPRLGKRAGAANQLGMCWKPAAIAARPATQRAIRIRTLCITPLSS